MTEPTDTLEDDGTWWPFGDDNPAWEEDDDDEYDNTR